MSEPRRPSSQVPDAELRAWIDRIADELCLTVYGRFDHLVRMDVTDDSLEKLQMLVNFVLDNARRATEAQAEAQRLAHEQAGLMEEIGRIREMGQYRLEELLGRGGMGEVWRGRHKMLARPAAIKLIKPARLGNNGTAARDKLMVRFQREAQATAALRSPHTISVFDFGLHRGDFYYVMELLEGVDLDTLVKVEGALPPERVAYLLRQACHSLYEAHQAGMIHRDVKPGNLFLCRHGIDYDFLKVLDFGLVKLRAQEDSQVDLTQEGEFSGTPAYLSPEQIRGVRDIDHRADLYALGCCAYYLLTGQKVFSGDHSLGVMIRHVKDAPQPMNELAPHPVPPELDALVMQCLAKAPEDRPADAWTLAERLTDTGLEAGWTVARRKAWWETWAKHETSIVDTEAPTKISRASEGTPRPPL